MDRQTDGKWRERQTENVQTDRKTDGKGTDRQTENGPTDRPKMGRKAVMTQLIVTFRNFANMLKIKSEG
jgi:hypothetical protein